MPIKKSPAPRIDLLPAFSGNQDIYVLRLDLPDPLTGGNKRYKLKYNLEEMRRLGLNRLLTFGGAFSNHIAAVAAAGKREKIATTGIIRGEELHENSNAVLSFAAACGMQLVFISRDDYRKRNDATFQEQLLKKFGPAHLLPEGGSNAFAVQGCKEILPENDFDLIVCPVGTGGTLAGIIASARKKQHVTGIAVLNGKDYLEKEIERLLGNENAAASWNIHHDFTFGGYAQSSPELEQFIHFMKEKYALPLDHVYSGKALYALYELMRTNAIGAGKKILFIHTAGYAFSEDNRG